MNLNDYAEDSSLIQHPNTLLDTITRSIGQGIEAANTGTVPQTLRDESPFWKQAGGASDAANFQVANGGMAGIPGSIIKSISGKTPSTGNALLDSSLSTVGGMSGLPGAASNVAAQGIDNPLLRGLMRGGTFMGAMPGSMEQRAKNTATGAIFGPPTELAGDLAVKGFKAATGLPRFLKDVFSSGGRLANVNEELAGTENQLAQMNQPATTAYGPLTNDQGTKLGQKVLDKAQGSMVGEVENAGKNVRNNITENYKAQKKDLASKFNKATQNEVADYKTAMEDAAAQNTPLYGERLDKLQAGIKEPIKPEEYNQKVIQPALKEIAEKRLPLGGPEATIKSWEQKFSPSTPETEGVPETDILGMPKPAPAKEPSAPLTLRGINNIKNDIYNSQSYGARLGTAKPDPSDVANNIFYKYHTDFMNQRVPGHAELQGDAGPMIESTRNIHKAIRPGEQEVQPGMNLLQKAAKGRANPAKENPDIENDLKNVEQGYGGFKGTGNLRGQSTKIAQDMHDLDLKFSGNEKDLIDQIDRKIAQIKTSFAEDSSVVNRASMTEKENMLESQGRLNQRKASLEKRQQDLTKLKGVRDWIIGSAAGTAGVEGLYHGTKKLFNF